MDQSIHEFYLVLKGSYDYRKDEGDINQKVFTEVFENDEAKQYANDGNPRQLGKRLKFSS